MAAAASVTSTAEKAPPSIADTKSNMRQHPLNNASGATKLLHRQLIDHAFLTLRQHKNSIAHLEDELQGLLGAQTTSLQSTLESLAQWITDVERETAKQQGLNAHIVGGHMELMERVAMLEKRDTESRQCMHDITAAHGQVISKALSTIDANILDGRQYSKRNFVDIVAHTRMIATLTRRIEALEAQLPPKTTSAAAPK